jgi:hypothetical protein
MVFFIIRKFIFPSLALSVFDLLEVGSYGFLLGFVPVAWPAIVVTPILLLYHGGLVDFVSSFPEVLYACFLGIIIGFTVCIALCVLMFKVVSWLWNRTYVKASKMVYEK